VDKATNGVCPEETKACSSVTTGSNIICYPEAELEANCPITDIQFSAGEEKYLDYTRVDYLDGIQVAYTKTLADSRPITTTSVEFRPCLNA